MIAALALCVGSPVLNQGFAQQQLDLTSGSFTTQNPEEKLHAVSLTRFHFSSLKTFQSELFDYVESQKKLANGDASLLNSALDAFLTSASRENLLLTALRERKAVQLKFVLRKKSETARMVQHPRKELLYRFQPMVEEVPVVIEIRPLLDGPRAFEIDVSKGKEHRRINVDWAGQIAV